MMLAASTRRPASSLVEPLPLTGKLPLGAITLFKTRPATWRTTPMGKCCVGCLARVHSAVLSPDEGAGLLGARGRARGYLPLIPLAASLTGIISPLRAHSHLTSQWWAAPCWWWAPSSGCLWLFGWVGSKYMQQQDQYYYGERS